MSDINDGTATDDTTAGAEGSGESQTPEQKPSGTEDPIALARKRQAGAEAARQKAQEEAAELRKRLEAFESANKSAAEQDLADNAKLQERLTAAEKRAEQAELMAAGKILDFKYPNARAELPDVTDEVKLARFEALLKDTEADDASAPPPPQNPNESNRTASGDATAKAPREKSSQDILAEMKAAWPTGRPE